MSDTTGTIAVKNNQSAHRFEAEVDGGTAFASYELRGKEIVFTHTEVPEQSRGGGVGDALARAGLDWARAQGLEAVAACTFIAAYMRRHRAL